MTTGGAARRALARLARASPARLAPGRRRVPAPPFASSSNQPLHGSAWEGGGGGGGGAPNPGRRDRGANVPPAAASDPRASSFAARAWISSEADAITDAAAPTERKRSANGGANNGVPNGGPVVELWGDDADGVDLPPPPPPRQTQTPAPPKGETLSGEIRRVTFHNPDNQWTVARLLVSKSHVDQLPIGATATQNNNMPKYKQRKSKKGAKADKVVTVVGNIPGVAEGQFLEMCGEWREVDKWGMQFQLSATPIEVVPQDEDAILRYLAGGALPGVGKVTAGKLVSHFGAKTFEVFDSPDAVSLLIDCPGIGKKTAEKLKGNWDETRGRRDAIVFLERYGVAPALAQRVAALHGTKTEARVRDDPFGSMAGLRGATFHRCDSLAARLGKKPDDPARLAAAMLQVLQSTAVSEGHVYVPWAQIEEGVGRVLGSKQFASLPSGALEEAADVLRTRGDVARFELTGSQTQGGHTGDENTNTNGEWERSGVFASVLHDAEAFVAADVAARLRKPSREPDVPRVRRWLQAAASKEGWRLLSPAQEAFLDLALREPISVLTGGPGTGKTFATHIAVRLWRAMGRKVLMCAPTGRAAQRLAEIATAGRRMSQPVQSSTIHRLLETRKGRKGGGDTDDESADDQTSSLSYKGAFARNRSSPLDADVVVVDESSMLDLPLCAALLDAIKPDAQIVFVGDADQLPSVGPGSVLGDIISSGAVPAVQLRDVFRQAEASGIVRAAHAINGGFLPAVPTRRWDPSVGDIVRDDSIIDHGSIKGTLTLPGGSEVTYETQTWDGADCVWVTLPDDSPAGFEGALEALFRGALPALDGLDPASDLQVLTPFRRGPASTQQLNAYLQARLNPPGRGRLETRNGDVIIREGDRVLQQRNDYTKEVFNGDLGTVVAVDGDGGVRVVFGGAAAHKSQGQGGDEEEDEPSLEGGDDSSDTPLDTIERALASLKHGGREVSYTRTDLRDLIPAWALTVHKAQGSEYRAVVLTLANAHRPLLRRELVYTAVSRAKEVLVVLAPRQALETAVNAVGTNSRNTTLARRLAPLAPNAPSCPATAAIAAAADEVERKGAGGGGVEEV